MCTLFPLLRGLEIQLEGRGLFLCISRGVFWRKKLQNPKVGVLLEAESKGGFLNPQAAFCIRFPEDLRRGFPNRLAYWRTIVVFGVKRRKTKPARCRRV